MSVTKKDASDHIYQSIYISLWFYCSGFGCKNRYPVWMPRTKRQCIKCHWFMCLGFWGWGEHFLYWGFGQWHFVIGILSRDRKNSSKMAIFGPKIRILWHNALLLELLTLKIVRPDNVLQHIWKPKKAIYHLKGSSRRYSIVHPRSIKLLCI